jgi:hypothetical protein
MLAAQSGDYYSRAQPTPAAYDFTDITELLNSAQIDWKYYVTSAEAPDPENGHAVGSESQQRQMPGLYTYWNPLPAFPHVQGDPEQRNRIVGRARLTLSSAPAGHCALVWPIGGPVYRMRRQAPSTGSSSSQPAVDIKAHNART